MRLVHSMAALRTNYAAPRPQMTSSLVEMAVKCGRKCLFWSEIADMVRRPTLRVSGQYSCPTLAGAVAALFLACAPAQAQMPAAVGIEPARLAVAREIVAVVLPPAQRQQIMSSFLAAMMRNMIAGIVDGTPGLKQEIAANPRIKDTMDRFVARQQRLAEGDIDKALPELVEAYARAYARNFTVDELAAVKAFVTTPAGTKFIQRGNALMSDPDVATWQRKVTEVEAGRQQAELAAFQQDLTAARAGAGK